MAKIYDVLVLDIDGTTVNSNKEVDVRTQEALIALQEAGTTVILASGRPPEGVYSIAKLLEFDRFNGHFIAFNGAKVMRYTDKVCLHETCLDHSVIELMYDTAKTLGLGIMTYDEGRILAGTKPDAYMRGESEWCGLPLVRTEDFISQLPVNPHQCLLTGNKGQLSKLVPQLIDLVDGRAEVFHSDLYCIEISPPGMNKSVGVDYLFKRLGLSRKRAVFCGDSYNDVAMLAYAHMGVAMRNAPQPVRRQADYVTKLTNDEAGVVEVVHRYFTI
ncbi:MAG: HAD family hydrolase [Veillonella sp.]|uniref:HAD family hydrolase n=1 Tax=Veillonella sp. TaxID=1926307 RepID=UPI0025F8067C|nr:HAD family hydrolase [Veillonella sp.]MBS4914156.1 HAD family hydrolase [Veillonella sp.]